MSDPTKQAPVRVICVGSLDQHTYIPALLWNALWTELERRQAVIRKQEALLAGLATELETLYDTLDSGARALLAEAANATETAGEDDYAAYLLTGEALERVAERVWGGVQ